MTESTPIFICVKVAEPPRKKQSKIKRVKNPNQPALPKLKTDSQDLRKRRTKSFEKNLSLPASDENKTITEDEEVLKIDDFSPIEERQLTFNPLLENVNEIGQKSLLKETEEFKLEIEANLIEPERIYEFMNKSVQVEGENLSVITQNERGTIIKEEEEGKVFI